MFEYLPDNVPIEETTKKSIANCAFTKVKKTKQKKLIKTVTSLAASFAVVFCMLWIVGFENVASAAEKIFYFLPGFGTAEQTDEETPFPMLTLKEQVSAENENCSITIYHAATSDKLECANSKNLTEKGIAFTFEVDVQDTLWRNLEEKYPYFDPDTMKYDTDVYLEKEIVTTEAYDIALIVDGKEYSNDGYGWDVSWNQKYGTMEHQNYGVFTDGGIFKEGAKYSLKISNKHLGTVEIPFELVSADELGSGNNSARTVTKFGTTFTAITYEAELNDKEYIALEIEDSNNYEDHYAATYELDYDNSGRYIMFQNPDGTLIPWERGISGVCYFDKSKVNENAVLRTFGISANLWLEQNKDYEFTIPIPKEVGQTVMLDTVIETEIADVVLESVTLKEINEEGRAVLELDTRLDNTVSPYYYSDCWINRTEAMMSYINETADDNFRNEYGSDKYTITCRKEEPGYIECALMHVGYLTEENMVFNIKN